MRAMASPAAGLASAARQPGAGRPSVPSMHPTAASALPRTTPDLDARLLRAQRLGHSVNSLKVRSAPVVQRAACEGIQGLDYGALVDSFKYSSFLSREEGKSNAKIDDAKTAGDVAHTLIQAMEVQQGAVAEYEIPKAAKTKGDELPLAEGDLEKAQEEILTGKFTQRSFGRADLVYDDKEVVEIKSEWQGGYKQAQLEAKWYALWASQACEHKFSLGSEIESGSVTLDDETWAKQDLDLRLGVYGADGAITYKYYFEPK